MVRNIRRRRIYFTELPREKVESALSEFAPYCSLSPLSKIKIYVLLCSARGRYDFRLMCERAVKIPQVLRELRKLQGPLRRIANFGRDTFPFKSNSAKHTAASAMMLAANDWASQQDASALPPPFQSRKWESGIDFHSWDVIHQFFNNARLISVFADRAEANLEMRKRRPRNIEFDESAIEWLVGGELPRIYGKVFREEFTVWAANTGMSDGCAFAIAALEAMQLRTKKGRYSANTLRVHHRAFRQISKRKK
jgi:hypothetical protein